jgi:hypothetical protein
VRRALAERHPQVAPDLLSPRVRACVNDTVVGEETIIAPGETIVFVAASAAHRRAAFEAADYMMDRLKTEAIFWKREDTADGTRWIEPTATDHADRARWSDDGN